MTSEEDSSGLEKTLKELEISSNVGDELLRLDINPFHHRRPRSRSTGSICTCLKKTHHLNENSKSTFKRSSKKLLRDPILKYISKHTFEDIVSNKTKLLETAELPSESVLQVPKVDDVSTVVDGCERLSLDSETEPLSSRGNCNQASCSQEAIAGMGMGINPPCDVSVDELASYFENFVHIPKKMSSMAEMMYI